MRRTCVCPTYSNIPVCRGATFYLGGYDLFIRWGGTAFYLCLGVRGRGVGRGRVTPDKTNPNTALGKSLVPTPSGGRTRAALAAAAVVKPLESVPEEN